MTKKLVLEFTTAEANAVLQGLAQFPYAQVSGLIDNIRTQAAPQLADVQKSEADAAAEEVQEKAE